MKTKEFIRQVENLYFKVSIDLYSIKISCDFGGIPIATVSENRQNKMNTRFITFNSLDIEKQNKLFNLLVEYASTPIEERKEEKKYCFYLNHISNRAENFLNYNVENEDWIISDNIETHNYKMKFTLAELPYWAKEMLEQGHLVKEEVE